MSGPSTGSDRPVEGRHDLVAYLEAGPKPPEAWRIGTEHEKFGFSLDDLRPPPYEGPAGIRAMLEGLQRFGWQPISEGGNVIALSRDGENVSLEPGGQLELSGAPLATLHETCNEVNRHLEEVKTVAGELGLGFLGVGAQPKWARQDIPMMPKGRYGIMRRYMPTKGSRGLDMMFRTCTVQVNLDFGSEAQMVEMFRLALALQPIATALFANSPFLEGKPNGYLSYRAYAWLDTDPDRTGLLPWVFEDGMGFERYADFALDVPMYFVYRDGRYIDAAGQSFRDFLAGALPALPGEKPSLKDWEDHLTTIFPEVRLKHFLEMRGADGGPWDRLCALPALWVGLLYDSGARAAAWDLVRDWSAEERERLRVDVMKEALGAPVGDTTVRELARQVLTIARAGLERRARRDSLGGDESHFLRPLDDIVARGETPAEALLRAYETDWQGDIDRLFAAHAY